MTSPSNDVKNQGKHSEKNGPQTRTSPWELAVGPPPDQWNHWTELDPSKWPQKVERHYQCIPTICFNCEAACGLLAFVDKSTEEIVKFEGNPVHPGSRGRTCAKGPATLNQIQDPERILSPLKRDGPRGSGKWKPVSWDDALDDIAGRIANALDEDRHDEVIYHVGRPGEDHFIPRLLAAWGVDGHNSHTNVCSAAARLGYQLWLGADRPSPSYDGTQFILLLSAHLETGHYFNPHAQRIMEAKESGARIAVVDCRLSNTSTHADHWISPWPGSEAALLLAVAREILERGAIDREFVQRWVNWEETLATLDPDGPGTFDHFLQWLREQYDQYTPEFVESECKIPAATVISLADEIEKAKGKFSSHLWRNAASGHLFGFQIARALMLLHVLTGSVGKPGGVNPNSWDKVVPSPSENPPPGSHWNELIWPREFPLAHYEMSFLLPHLRKDSDRHIAVYFTRVYNPVWTNPDGCSWIAMLEDEEAVGCHIALTPTWNETAQWADYVLPMGLSPERHDLMSQETHAGTWVGFRQPVGLEMHRRQGGKEENPLGATLGSNPGEVWEEAEFWIALTWRIDPDGSRGMRQWYESKKQPGEPITLDEYFGDIFDNNVPGLPEAADAEGMTPLEYMRRYGAFEVPYAGQERYESDAKEGVHLGKETKAGFNTPSGRLELYSPTLAEWDFEEHAMPTYKPGQVHWSEIDLNGSECVLLPTFRLPTLIHTRSANAKWLQEISHTNPLWVSPGDAERLNLSNGELARVTTGIGHFVLRVWITEGIRPGVVACSHHVGRWHLHKDGGSQSLAMALVDIERSDDTFLFRQKEGVSSYSSADSDTSRIWWHETGVNQNLTFPVQPDPVSGMHCWHQKVSVEPAREEDRYGDVFVDLKRSMEHHRSWLEKTKPAPGPDGLRRPLWLNRPLRPEEGAFHIT